MGNTGHAGNTDKNSAKQRARAIAREELQQYVGRDFKEQYLKYAVGGTIQATLFEEGWTYDILSVNERQNIVGQVLSSMNMSG